jgi:hypothetical protein
LSPHPSFTVPEGEWVASAADNPDHIEIEPELTDPVDDAVIGFHHMTHVFPPAEGGVQAGDAVAGPADFADWLTSSPAPQDDQAEAGRSARAQGASRSTCA